MNDAFGYCVLPDISYLTFIQKTLSGDSWTREKGRNKEEVRLGSERERNGLQKTREYKGPLSINLIKAFFTRLYSFIKPMENKREMTAWGFIFFLKRKNLKDWKKNWKKISLKDLVTFIRWYEGFWVSVSIGFVPVNWASGFLK